MDKRKDLIVEAMKNVLNAKNIIERNDAPVRKAEGLELQTGILEGAAPSAPIAVEIKGERQRGTLQLEIDLLHGQKTGFYLDQKENYGIVAQHSLGKRVLDCFTNQGGFALACALAGATDVTAVEASAENLAGAKNNAQRNGVNVRWVEGDVFQFLRGAEKSGAQFDLIVLDPPSFTKGKGGLHDAVRGYKELHVRAFKLLSRDGILATFSCSHHVTHEVFAGMIRDALVDARRSARLLRRFDQPLDHPVLPTLPETEYFKGFLLEMMPGR